MGFPTQRVCTPRSAANPGFMIVGKKQSPPVALGRGRRTQYSARSRVAPGRVLRGRHGKRDRHVVRSSWPKREVTTMAGSAKATIDHDEIRAWVEARGGYPARARRGGRDGGSGLLRIDFQGPTGQRALERIGWDQFFDWFENNQLAFLYQEHTAEGRQSRFSKMVERETIGLEGDA